MNGGFVETLKVTDEWMSGGETFRLVDRGAGPRELQIERGGSWVAESPQYVHGVLCARIEFLANRQMSNEDTNKTMDAKRRETKGGEG
jgi:hypothetical protein